MTTLRWTVLFFPTLVAAIYLWGIATNRYVSEAEFVVRTASRPASAAGLGALLQMTGLGRAQDEVFAVQAFMGSRTAAERLGERVPLKAIYGNPDADFIARFPSVIFGDTKEELHSYLGWMIETIYDSTTGITKLRVQAFESEDARQVALDLLELGEQHVNQMNERINTDAIRLAAEQLQQGEDRLVAAQQALTRFRNKELLIDAAGSTIVVTEVIGRLTAELSQVEAQIREITAGSATSPQLPSLRRRVEANQAQITRERERISSDDEGLAQKLANYERLVLDAEFAKQALSASARAFEAAQLEARRQQLYLERIVEPVAADKAMAPARWRLFASIFGLNAILLLVGWLVIAGAREHAEQQA
ncbi:MAG: chain-length determining protein [Pseudomonadota bacterium]